MKIYKKTIIVTLAVVGAGLIGGKALSNHHKKTKVKSKLTQKEKQIDWEEVSG